VAVTAESPSGKLSATMKTVGLAGVVAVLTGIVTKIWDGLPPTLVSLLVTGGLMCVFGWASWRVTWTDLEKAVQNARDAAPTEAEKDSAEEHKRLRLVVPSLAFMTGAIVLAIVLTIYVCSILGVLNPINLFLEFMK